MEILIARTENEIETAARRLSASKAVGCDTETSGLDSNRGRLFSVQFSDGEFNVLVPISEGVKLGRMAQILSDPQITKIFHNAKFDLGFLGAAGINVAGVYCTMIAEKVLTRGAGQSVSLAETLYRYFAVDLDKSQRKKFNKNWNGVWTDELVHYALSDVAYLPELKTRQEEWLEKLGLTESYLEQFIKSCGSSN